MTYARFGVSSASEASTYQENRTSKMIDLTFLSKGELRRAYEVLWMEKGTKDLKIKELEEEASILRKKLLAFQATEIEQLKEKITPIMRIAI